jgi:hypothetical protein
MAVIESKLKDGTLTLGTTPLLDFSCQVINCRVNTTYDDEGDTQETLCGDVIAAGRKIGGRSLAGTFIQDWTAAAASSITEYCYDNELETVPFEYTPNGAAGPTISGNVRIEVPAETYGGDVNVRITSDFEWQIVSGFTRTPGVAALAEPEPETAGV